MLKLLIALFLLHTSIHATPISISGSLPDINSPLHIPKIFHTIWFDFGKGTTVFPKYVKNMEELKALHPEWEFKEWNEQKVESLITEKYPWFLNTYNSYDRIVKKHDASRIAILNTFGGVYLDHDFVPIKNIEPLLKSYKFVVGTQTNDYLKPANGFIASVPNSYILMTIMNFMNNPDIAKADVLSATGPEVLKKSLEKFNYTSEAKYIKVYEQDVFYPVSYKNKSPLNKLDRSNRLLLFPNSYLVQTYDSNWYD